MALWKIKKSTTRYKFLHPLSKSELVNELIRQARKQEKQIDWIREKIELAEASGFTSDNKAAILKQSKENQ